MRSATLLALLLLGPVPLIAQTTDPVLKPARVYVGGSFIVAEPQQDFRDHVNTSYGGSMDVLWTPRADGPLGWRFEAGAIGYGNENKQVLLSPTVGGRVTVRLNTSNVIGFAHAGPQFTFKTATVQPYIAPSLGLTYIATVSSLNGDGGESFAHDTNYDDVLFSYGATGGAYLPITTGKVPVLLDFAVRYYQNGQASYLVKGSIHDNPDGTISYDPIRTSANMVTFQFGVSVGLRPSHKMR